MSGSGGTNRTENVRQIEDLAATLARRRDEIPRDPENYPVVSFEEERLLLLEHMGSTGTNYSLSAAFRIEGPFDANRCRSALQSTIERHSAFWSAYEFDGNNFVRVRSIRCLDYEQRALSSGEDLDALLAGYATERFRIAEGPLVRARLIELAPDEVVLYLSLHHLVADGQSVETLLNQFAQAYSHPSEAAAGQDEVVLYHDYAAWQRSHMVPERSRELLRHWLSVVDGADFMLAWQESQTGGSGGGDKLRFLLSPEARAGVEETAKGASTSPFVVLMAVFQLLIGCLSGSVDFLVGTPMDNRPLRKLESVVGFFTGPVPIRARFTSVATVEDHLATVRATVLSAMDHQALPFERLVNALRPPRVAGRNPLFQTMFLFRPSSIETLELAGVKLSSLNGEPLSMADVEVRTEESKLDILLSVEESGNGYVCSFEFLRHALAAETATSAVALFQDLVEAFVLDPLTSLDRLPNAGNSGIDEC